MEGPLPAMSAPVSARQRQLLERIRPEMSAEDMAAWCRDREAPLQEAS